MTSKRGTRTRACEGKKAFDDPDYADKAAEDMDERYARPAGWFTAYACRFCRRIHVGHENKAMQPAGRKSYRRP